MPSDQSVLSPSWGGRGGQTSAGITQALPSFPPEPFLPLGAEGARHGASAARNRAASGGEGNTAKGQKRKAKREDKGVR